MSQIPGPNRIPTQYGSLELATQHSTQSLLARFSVATSNFAVHNDGILPEISQQVFACAYSRPLVFAAHNLVPWTPTIGEVYPVLIQAKRT